MLGRHEEQMVQLCLLAPNIQIWCSLAVVDVAVHVFGQVWSK